MATTYKRLSAEYSFVISSDGIEGREVYVSDANGPIATLPTVGTTPMLDPNGNQKLACLCRNKRYTYMDGHVPTIRVECTFSTKSGDGDNSSNEAKGLESVNGQAGLETVRIDAAEGGWTAGTGGATLSGDIYLTHPTGAVSIPKVCEETKRADFEKKLVEELGCINSAALKLPPCQYVGCMLFEGFSYSSRVTEESKREWLYQLHYRWRFLPSAAGRKPGPPLPRSWNYRYKSDGSVEEVVDKDGNPKYADGSIDADGTLTP